MQTQTWNSLIEYIKIRLGVPINQIEMTDDDIQTYLREHLIPEISQFTSDKKFVTLLTTSLADNPDPPASGRTYTIPFEDDYSEIIEVRNVYFRKTWGIGLTANSVVPVNPVDYAMLNELTDIARSMMPVDTYEYIRPNTLILDEELQSDAIIELRISHKELKTIPSDIYHEIVKPLALGQIYLLLASYRSKYENLTTPYGTINLNWQQLKDDGNTLLQQVAEKLDMVPPDHLIEFF